MDAKKAKLIKEAVILGVAVLLIALVGIMQFGWFQKGAEPAKKKALETEFNINAYEAVKNRQDDYPTINLDGIGKDNPFAF